MKMLELEGRVAQETVAMENDEPAGSQEVNSERGEVVGVCSKDVGVGLLMESRESADARGEEPSSTPTGASACGKMDKTVECSLLNDGMVHCRKRRGASRVLSSRS